MDLKKYYSSVQKIAAKLDPETASAIITDPDGSLPSKHYRMSQKAVWLMSVENDEKGSVAGSVIEANPWVAAERLYDKTHELASEAQIEGEVQRRKKQSELIARLEEERQGKANAKDGAREMGEVIAASNRQLIETLASQLNQKQSRVRGDNNAAV
jgi:hypothetical protein